MTGTYVKSNVRKNLRLTIDLITLVVLGLLLIRMMQGVVLLGDYFPSELYRQLRKMLPYLAVAKILLMLPDWKKLIVPVGLGLLYYLHFRIVGYDFSFVLAFLTIACIDIDYRWLLKEYVIIVGIMISATILAGLCDAGQVLVYTRNNSIRSAMGFTYPTDAASILLFFTLIAGVFWTAVPDWILALTSFFSAGIVFFITRSYTSTLMFCLYACFLILCSIFKRTGMQKKLRKLFALLMAAVFPTSILVTFGLIYLYIHKNGTGIIGRLDSMLHNRISLAAAGFERHGLKIFGTLFAQKGAGSSVVQNPEYNFIDNSYALMLVRCGWLILLVLCCIWSFRVWKLTIDGNTRAALAMTVIALHSFSEHHFIEFHYNFFLLLLFSDFYIEKRGLQDQKICIFAKGSVKKKISIVVAAFIGILTAIVFPHILMWIRNVCQVSGRVNSDNSGGLILLGFSALVIFFLIIGRSVWYIIKNVFMEEQHKMVMFKHTAILIVGIIVSLAGYTKGEQLLRRYEPGILAIISEEEEFIDIVRQASVEKIYADQYAGYYQRLYDGISASLLNSDALANKKSISIITKRDHESKTLLAKGFLYTQINEYHSLYTNNQDVIDALLAAGYPCNGYYSSSHEVDLTELAVSNQLPMDETSILLSGAGAAINKGPDTSVLAGTYTVTWDLSIYDKATADQNTPLLIVKTVGNNDEVLAQQEVVIGDFDAAGHCQLSLEFYTDDCYAIRFPIEVLVNQSVKVDHLSWTQCPEYDIRTSINKKGQVIERAYYNNSGYRTTQNNGYSLVQFAYDQAGNRVDEWYFDEKDQLVIVEQGYAHLHRIFNELNQVYREEYYGLNDEPVLRDWGIAAMEMEYDAQGRVSAERYFGIDGERCELPAGYSMTQYAYDSNGKCTDEWYFDQNDEPIARKQGFWHVHRMFDENGRKVREEYYDLYDNLVMSTYGYAVIVYEYDTAGDTETISYYDSDNILLD